MVRLLSERSFSVKTRSSEETKELGKLIGKHLKGGEVILLEGPLGAGKTTMVQGIAQGLGIRKPVNSPSFVLEKIYEGRCYLHHFDFYRLDEKEIEDAGLLLDLDPEAVVVIEWADRLSGELDKVTLRIRIHFSDRHFSEGSVLITDDRTIDIATEDESWARLIEEFVERGNEEDE